ncbi:MAG: DUF892 family protein [Methylobacteriaceae bacterium]|nr:DUF892 family protein [Methylobacteriaceae bacterium]
MKGLFVQGLQAMHAADEQGKITTADIEKAATDPRLKEALRHAHEVAGMLDRQLGEVMQAANARPQPIQNAAIEGIATDAQRVREMASDPVARDLGIIAHAQIALHYHIAAYGTLRSYAQALGNEKAAGALQSMLEQAKGQDETYSRVARDLLGKG